MEFGFAFPCQVPASTALLNPGRIRLPLQEQIDFIAKCCRALRGADRAPALPRARDYRKVSSEGFSPSEPHAVKQSLGIGMRGSVEKRSSLIHFDYLTASHDHNLIASERQSQDRRLRSIGRHQFRAFASALRPDRALQFRILLGPALRSTSSAAAEAALFARFLCYFGQVRLLLRAHRRLQPPAFPTTSRARLAGTAMEISRFPCKRLLRMPGSTTTRGRHVCCDIDTSRVAFCRNGKHQHPQTCLTPLNTSPAPSPVNASRLPSRATRASLGAAVSLVTECRRDTLGRYVRKIAPPCRVDRPRAPLARRTYRRGNGNHGRHRQARAVQRPQGEYDNHRLPSSRPISSRPPSTDASRMGWDFTASPTCQPNGPASTRCSVLLRSSGMFGTSRGRRAIP
jgi:hypothetical protein